MKKAPSLWTLQALAAYVEKGPRVSVDGRTWHPARPWGFFSIGSRLECAWAVFSGRADALIWPVGQ